MTTRNHFAWGGKPATSGQGSGGGGSPPSSTASGGMMKTPQAYTPTIIAGGYYEIHDYGRYLCLLSITGAASIELAFDDDPLQVVRSPTIYDCGDLHYTRVLLHNTAGVPVAVALTVGDIRVDFTGGDLMASLVALMTTLVAKLSGVAVMTQPVITTLAITGGAPTAIFAITAARRRVSVQALPTNTGYVYLGNALAHCSDADAFAVLAPGQPWSDDYFTGAVYGVGTDALQQVACYQE